jgi:DNA-binding transcriptional ArsR family regulator
MSPRIKKLTETPPKQGTFAALYFEGRASADEIDDFVDDWHEGGTGMSLHDFLGLSREDYAQWVEQPDSLETALNERKHERGADARHRRSVEESSKVKTRKETTTQTSRHSERSAKRPSDFHQSAILLRQLSDPIRLQVILTLDEGEKHVAALCIELGASQPTLSHHLALLRHADIVVDHRRGKYQYYKLTKAGEEIVKAVKSLFG